MTVVAPTSFGQTGHFATVARRGTQEAELSTAHRLTTTIALLAAVASAGGLFLPQLYRDNAFVVSAWKGTDLITLVVAVPILAAAAAFARHGSTRALFVWFGLLDYMLYNYAFYLFGAAFNAFFLLYTALFTLSALALVFGLVKADVGGIGRRFSSNTPVRWISGYMLLVAAGLSTAYLFQAMTFIVSGQLPPIVEMSGHPTSVVFALDLSLLVPGLVLGGVWLWKREPWGYVLAGILNVKGAVYTLALAVASAWAARTGTPAAAIQVPLWLFLSILSLTASGLLIVNFRPSPDRLPPETDQ